MVCHRRLSSKFARVKKTWKSQPIANVVFFSSSEGCEQRLSNTFGQSFRLSQFIFFSSLNGLFFLKINTILGVDILASHRQHNTTHQFEPVNNLTKHCQTNQYYWEREYPQGGGIAIGLLERISGFEYNSNC